ncbi:hypothetical protein MY4824_005783 [Beauveria thailandica]
MGVFKSSFVAILVLITSVSVSCSPVPSVNHAAVQKHKFARSAMIALEKSQRQDHAFRQNLSPTAKKADEIVRAIRQDEIDHFWKVPSVPGDDTTERFAGQMFPLARPYILETKLWRVVKRMPKGALLHAHLLAMLPYEVLLDTVFHTDGMTVSSSHNLATEESRREASILFSYSEATPLNSPTIESTDYVPRTPVSIQSVLMSFPGGEEAFLNFTKSKMTMAPNESVRHELGVDQVWRRFENVFSTAASLLTYEPIVRTFYQRLFERLADDGISWVEIRTGGPKDPLMRSTHGNPAQNRSRRSDKSEQPSASPDLWWEVLEDELKKFKATVKGRNFWGARVIWTDSRAMNSSLLIHRMKLALDSKVRFPDLISGYDLVGQEDLGRPLVDLTSELLWFQEQAHSLNVSMPFFFHAGETLGDGSSTDENLFDALLLGTRRIGHGFSLYKHPTLLRSVMENRVMVEVCPISNEVLRLATDILHHPLPAMIAHGVPTAVSNDDPAILGQDAAGLSYDFYQVIQGFDNIGLAGLGALAHNSLRWSHFEDQTRADWILGIDLAENGSGTKARYIQEWNRQWEDFCSWIVDEFGEQYGR